MYGYAVIIIFICIVISTCKSNILPSSKVDRIIMKPIIDRDDLLIDKTKSAIYDYITKGTIYTKKIMKYRERLLQRFHFYRKIKNMDVDNPGVAIDYIEYRMEEFSALLQGFPPF